MENRRRLLHPFPVDAMAVYRSAWTTREYEAISMLFRSHGGQMFRLKEEFKPEAFAPFNAVIAECLMLPEIEGEEIGSVESHMISRVTHCV